LKFFNITGSIIPKKHYFAPTDDKIKQIFAMIEKGEYFVINKPRQFGKTTTLMFIENYLNKTDDYLCVSISFEGFGEDTFKNEKYFCIDFLNEINKTFLLLNQKELKKIIDDSKEKIQRLTQLSDLITELNFNSKKNLVVIIDEVDSAANYKLFIKFLGMLRKKYLDAGNNKDKTFHSIILAGVHDIKNLKEQIRGEDESVKFNSPWNIAANFDVIMELKPFAIEKMLADYKSEAKVQLNEKVLAEKIYYWTSGYPFLVSALCKIMDEELLPKKSIKKLDLNDLNDAIQILLSKKTTNFESLIKNIDNNPKIFNQVEKIILNGEKINFSTDNKIIESCIIYGIIRNEGEYCKIHNRIYEQRIYNYLLSKYQTDNGKTIASDIITSKYLDKKNDLILEKLLIDFQSIIKSKYASDDVLKSDEFLEKQVRLLFFVFLEPLLNNKGFAFKEVETSLEKRMDILIIYNNKKYIVELKLFYGQEYHKKGLEQLNDYLDRESINKGYIMIFNKKESKEFKSGWLKYKDKDIFELWF
jgi:hypothetical protein